MRTNSNKTQGICARAWSIRTIEEMQATIADLHGRKIWPVRSVRTRIFQERVLTGCKYSQIIVFGGGRGKKSGLYTYTMCTT